MLYAYNVHKILHKYYDDKVNKWIIPLDKKQDFCDALKHVKIEVMENGSCRDYYSTDEDSENEDDDDESLLALKKVSRLLEELEENLTYLENKIDKSKEVCAERDNPTLEKMKTNIAELADLKAELHTLYCDHTFECEKKIYF